MSVQRFAVGGDSTAQGIVNNTVIKPLVTEGGPGNWFELLAELIADIRGVGPRISEGIRPVYLGVGLAANVSPEWTFTGAWTAVTSSDAWDVLPYGQGQYANGAGFVATYTRTDFLRPNVGFVVHWIDYANGGNWRYRVDGGSWINMAQTLHLDNKLNSFYVNTPFASTVEFQASTNGTTGAGCFIFGIEPCYVDPTTATQGVIFDLIAQGGQSLHLWCASTAGDRFSYFDPAKIRVAGSALSPLPTAGFLNMNINDVLRADTTEYTTDLTTLFTKTSPVCPLGIINPYECLTATYNQAQQNAYRAQAKTTIATLAAANPTNPPKLIADLYDQWTANGWVGYAAASVAGLLRSADSTHEERAGHVDIAPRIYWGVRQQLFDLGGGNAFRIGQSGVGSTDVLGGSAVWTPGARAAETDQANSGTVLTTVACARATETDSPSAGTVAATAAGARSTETDSSGSGSTATSLLGARATEIDTANAHTPVSTAGGARATETDSGNADTVAASASGARGTENDSAAPIAAQANTTGALATEADTAQPFSPLAAVAGERGTETDTANAGATIAAAGGARGSETDSATSSTIVTTVTCAKALEIDDAFPVDVALPGATLCAEATEADTAHASSVAAVVLCAQATETDTAAGGLAVYTIAMAQATELSSALACLPRMTIVGGLAVEIDTALSVTNPAAIRNLEWAARIAPPGWHTTSLHAGWYTTGPHASWSISAAEQ